MPAILKFGNLESQKRPRSEDNDNDTSVSKKFPRIAIPMRSETKEPVKLLFSERKKKAERVEIEKFDAIEFLEELKKPYFQGRNYQWSSKQRSIVCFSIRREEFQ